jgi:transcriptional regulator GlxA family with amidase domain
MRVEILTFDGFDELDVVGAWEVLRSAAERGASWDVRLTARNAPATLHAAHGMTIVVDHAPSDPPPDLLIVPGGGWAARAEQGVHAELRTGWVGALASSVIERGGVVASVCTGALLLAAAGLLRDRPASTHGSARGALVELGARVVDARVVDDGDVVTAGGITAGIDLALWLVERFHGPRLAREVAGGIEHPGSGRAWRSEAIVRRSGEHAP